MWYNYDGNKLALAMKRLKIRCQEHIFGSLLLSSRFMANNIKLGGERSGSVVECLTRDRGAAGSSLTGITALWSLSMTHLSLLGTGSTQEDPSLFNWKIVDGTLRIKSNKNQIWLISDIWSILFKLLERKKDECEELILLWYRRNVCVHTVPREEEIWLDRIEGGKYSQHC